jgi:hypothetical protein
MVLHATDSNKFMRTCSVSRQLLGGCSLSMHTLNWKASSIVILMAGSMGVDYPRDHYRGTLAVGRIKAVESCHGFVSDPPPSRQKMASESQDAPSSRDRLQLVPSGGAAQQSFLLASIAHSTYVSSSPRAACGLSVPEGCWKAASPCTTTSTSRLRMTTLH